DRKGRILRGTAYYHINSMWWVVAGPYDLRNISCGEIFCTQPPDIRHKRNERPGRARLEEELSRAVRAMNFLRAQQLRAILFGEQPIYRIWSNEKDCFYRPCYAGYSSDSVHAGLYTFAEASKEVRRVPHILSAIAQDGRRLSAEDFNRM